MISVTNLVKDYGPVRAVDDISFEIEPGHVYGFLGPNGAGKSTTMNIITGCLSMSSGEVKIGGFDIFEEAKEAKKLIGYLPEIPPLYPDCTPREYLTFVAMAKGIEKEKISESIETVAEETGIVDVIDRLIKNLSKGYKQRVGIAQAILGNPQVVILDEPTVGLDPIQILEIRALIKKLGENHTVIFSSHILSEVQTICDRVLIISKGHLVVFDETENLGKHIRSSNAIEIRAKGDRTRVSEILDGRQYVKSFTCGDEDSEGYFLVRINLDETEYSVAASDIIAVFGQNWISVSQMNPVKANLEDVFVELTTLDEEERKAAGNQSFEAVISDEDGSDADNAADNAGDNTEDNTAEADREEADL